MTLSPMKTRSFRTLLAAAVLTVVAGGTNAQQTQLNPQAKRITDEAIHADLESYEATQGRIQALNDGGRPIRDYHLSKAQCWLDVSFHEYTRNDRSAFPQEALSERRAKTVRELLIGRGVAADKIRYEYRGDTQQVQQCDGVKPRAALLECLLPNRRVEVRFELGQ